MASSSRPTAGRTIATVTSSRATAPATRSWLAPATARCASRTARSRTSRRTSRGRSARCSEARLDPIHVRAQLLAHGLDLGAGLLGPHPLEVLLPGAVLGDPLAGEVARLDLAEDVAHVLARLVGDDALAARVVAVLGRVRDREPHALQALLVHEVDDELELVQALEVRHVRLVARLDERLEAGLDELGHAAAQDGLLAEEVGLGLVLERRLDHAAARAADALRIGERDVLRLPARVLGDRDQARHAAALGVLPADEVARALRG